MGIDKHAVIQFCISFPSPLLNRKSRCNCIVFCIPAVAPLILTQIEIGSAELLRQGFLKCAIKVENSPFFLSCRKIGRKSYLKLITNFMGKNTSFSDFLILIGSLKISYFYDFKLFGLLELFRFLRFFSFQTLRFLDFQIF